MMLHPQYFQSNLALKEHDILNCLSFLQSMLTKIHRMKINNLDRYLSFNTPYIKHI